MSDLPNRRADAKKLEDEIEDNVKLVIKNMEEKFGKSATTGITKKLNKQKNEVSWSRFDIVMDKPNVVSPLREINEELKEVLKTIASCDNPVTFTLQYPRHRVKIWDLVEKLDEEVKKHEEEIPDHSEFFVEQLFEWFKEEEEKEKEAKSKESKSNAPK